jgi:hypothetical protein
MGCREKGIQVRTLFRAITRRRVEEVIAIARHESGPGNACPPTRGMGRTAATTIFENGDDVITVESFVNSLPKDEQAELAGLMVLGREPLSLSVGDIAATCDPTFWRENIGRYLATKSRLAQYLEKGMRVVGL